MNHSHTVAHLLFWSAWWFVIATRTASGDENETAESKFGVVEGVITFAGDIPKSKVKDDAGQFRPLLTVDRRSRGLSFVVTYLLPVESQPPNANRSAEKNGEKQRKPVKVDQIEHRFVPHLIAIRESETVTFTNSDAANHNVRTIAFEDQNQFNIYTGAGGEYRHRFVAERKNRPVRLSCDIHPWMRGWVFVFRHSFYAVTDKNGRFRIASIPPGDYRLRVEQPDIKYRHERAVSVESATTKVEIEITEQDVHLAN